MQKELEVFLKDKAYHAGLNVHEILGNYQGVTTPEGKFYGRIINGMKNGPGILIKPTNEINAGNWEENKLEGVGVIYHKTHRSLAMFKNGLQTEFIQVEFGNFEVKKSEDQINEQAKRDKVTLVVT
eukprot:TRINITY_DN23203_c0_g1_i1.p1 TRINITY_DN23203_c0_g1~~TRINITY_DN23203_c0_g1_i1.p1  ORF type:complete len:126 (-),score=17.33 TRINITY_DN23203_c0_g1_i1:84-461(-)